MNKNAFGSLDLYIFNLGYNVALPAIVANQIAENDAIQVVANAFPFDRAGGKFRTRLDAAVQQHHRRHTFAKPNSV